MSSEQRDPLCLAGAHVGWQTARRRQQGLKTLPLNSLAHYGMLAPAGQSSGVPVKKMFGV